MALLLCIGLSVLLASVVTPVTQAQAESVAKVLVRGAPIHGANGMDACRWPWKGRRAKEESR